MGLRRGLQGKGYGFLAKEWGCEGHFKGIRGLLTSSLPEDKIPTSPIMVTLGLGN